jgi:N-acetylmuramoyl-L-alanine amidase
MVFMLASLRSALIVCAALSATTVAPALAGPAPEFVSAGAEPFADPLLPAASTALPTVEVPHLLDLEGEPELSAPPAIEESDAIAPEPAPAPAVRRTADLSSKVAELRSTNPGSRELECLAVGIYFESKSEPLTGQLAVGKVIANRANSGRRFPASYCGVLFQRGQFSFVRGKSWPAVNRSGKQWQNAVAIARIVDQDLHDSPVGQALFFHARYVSPRWKLKRVAAIGNHIFYR